MRLFPMIGESLGRYRITEIIGSGAMGMVYRAHDPTLDRDVALKIVNPTILGSDSGRDRFRIEALSLSRLNHPNICTIYEIGDSEGQTFIAMEYVRGQTLSSIIPATGLPLETTIRIGTQLARAIAHAHDQGIVHRDLKGSNIVVTPDGNVKVLDFGLAKRLTANEGDALQTEAALTEPGLFLGTPAYMSPEAVIGKAADARGDIWAVGIILYEMATGTLPFTGPTPVQFASAILKEPHAPLPPNVHPILRTVIQRCLAKEPGQRYQTGGELRAALEAAGSESVGATPARSLILSNWRRALGLLTVLAALVVLAVWAMHTRSSVAPGVRPIRSVAVLPLENLSGDPQQDYFADGMTEQLIADLSKIGTLRVISRTSTMQYKKARKPLPLIAQELNVDAIIEGSVVRVGDSVRITANLIRAATDESLWTQSYQRDVRDVLALQSEVARNIAGEVDITLTPQEQTRLRSARRVDPTGHQQVLLGRFHVEKGTEEGLHKGIEYFEQAIARDPGDADAYVGLAEAYTNLSSYYVHPREAMPKAKAAALTALKLDDSLASAHAALGFIHFMYDWDGPAAARELQRAIELNPSLASARLNYAGYLTTQGRYDEAAKEVERAIQLDPLSLRTHTMGSLYLTFTRRYDAAIALAQKALELEPNSAFSLTFQGVAYAEQGRFQEALRNLQKAAQLDRSPTILSMGAHVHAVAGDRAAAQKLLAEVEKIAKQRYFCPYEVGTAYVSLGDFDTASNWFRQGIRDRADCMAWLDVEPWLDRYRSDPRYEQLVREVGLAPGKRDGPK